MNNIRCCVIDDEPLASALIVKYIRKTAFLELAGEFDNCRDATGLIMDGRCDLVFLDIQMPQLNGTEFARVLPDTCRVIFTTAYDRYALDGFRVNALDYLLKPISYEDFLLSATKALRWFETVERAKDKGLSESGGMPAANDRIIVRSGYKSVQIKISEIEVVEGLKDYVKIFTAGSKNSVMTLISMKAIEKVLPASEFMRVHRSFIINTGRISAIERNRIVVGEHVVPVSESYREQFLNYIASHSVPAASKDD